jgi:hypothetical protein
LGENRNALKREEVTRELRELQAKFAIHFFSRNATNELARCIGARTATDINVSNKQDLEIGNLANQRQQLEGEGADVSAISVGLASRRSERRASNRPLGRSRSHSPPPTTSRKDSSVDAALSSHSLLNSSSSNSIAKGTASEAELTATCPKAEKKEEKGKKIASPLGNRRNRRRIRKRRRGGGGRTRNTINSSLNDKAYRDIWKLNMPFKYGMNNQLAKISLITATLLLFNGGLCSDASAVVGYCLGLPFFIAGYPLNHFLR